MDILEHNMNDTIICGILNVTPDSFSDGGCWNTTEKAVTHALKLIEDGAKMLDIGGESTRPGAKPVSASEEIKRIIPVIEAIKKKTNIPISVDTWKSDVALAALHAGADIINDITGFAGDKKMPEVIANTKCQVIIMANAVVFRQDEHSSKNFFLPKCEDYSHFFNEEERLHLCKLDIVQALIQYLKRSIDIAKNAGIDTNNISIDPGFGFGLTTQENIKLFKEISCFQIFHLPLFVGISRKRFVAEILQNAGFETAPHTVDGFKNRDYASAFLGAKLATNGVRILRVHSPYEQRFALTLETCMH